LPAYYAGLTPQIVLEAVESVGLSADGRMLALNSYENRVYRLGLEDGITGVDAGATQVVAKFYRAPRWSDAQIREEHAFAIELAAAELPVAAPLAFAGDSNAAPAVRPTWIARVTGSCWAARSAACTPSARCALSAIAARSRRGATAHRRAS
jgi:Ser/Thr protein kinase RdoA (MazF antagonist)